jgi:hypothetical protein
VHVKLPKTSVLRDSQGLQSQLSSALCSNSLSSINLLLLLAEAKTQPFVKL